MRVLVLKGEGSFTFMKGVVGVFAEQYFNSFFAASVSTLSCGGDIFREGKGGGLP
jgi:hypothetical protein